MAWDKSKPGDSEKIRSLGTVIRPNWEAIEEGDDVGTSNMLQMRSVQLDNRTGLAANNDPQTNAGTHYVYSKDDGGGVQEGFMKDSAANIIQMTNDGGLGAADMTINFANLTNDNGTTSYDERNLVAYWAVIAANGSILAQSETSGLSSVQNGGVSSYTITFATNQSSANYGVNITPLNTAGLVRIPSYSSPLAATVNVFIATAAGASIAGGVPFSITIYGGRPT